MRSALEGEHKQVTVLFVDIHGSMDLASRVDPEEWHSILDSFFQILADGIHRFEGTINQFTGDGIMALFGAPIAHEDHAERACFAALYLRDRLRGYANELRLERGLDFAVRIGLNSGEVVVGRIGDDLRMDYTAQGPVVGLAQRMENIAEPGTIYVTGATARLVEGFFELEYLGPARIKGVEEAVAVFRLKTAVPMRTRLDIARARGLSTFVGRRSEMATLDRAEKQARQGRGTVAGIVGAAGTGKSRLAFEFVNRCHARGLRVLEIYGVPHGFRVPLWPLVRLFRRFFEVEAADDSSAVRQKITARVAAMDRRLLGSLPMVFDFLGVAGDRPGQSRMDPEVLQRRLFDALRRMIVIEARKAPLVIVIEDLHWIDQGSDEFLHRLARGMGKSRLLLVVTFRPEYHARWSKRSRYTEIQLSPLTEEDVEAMLDDLLGDDDSLIAIKQLIRERADGNPLYVEEIVRSLADAGNVKGRRGHYRLVGELQTIGVPDTVQALIESRIDRLDDSDKKVLMLAAVIGKQFSAEVLERISSLTPSETFAALQSLMDAGYIFQISVYPTQKFVFAHPLTQEVAYAAQLTEQRRIVHSEVAKAIEETGGRSPDRKAAVIAYHYERGGADLEAARWYRRAARWAGRNDLQAAYEYWFRVRSLLEGQDGSEEVQTLGLAARWRMLNLGWRIGLEEPMARRLFEEGRDLARQLGDLSGEVGMLLFFGITRMMAGALEEALGIFADARRLAETGDDENLLLQTLGPPIHAYISAGRLDEALRDAEEGIAALRDRPEVGREMFGLTPSLYLRCCRGEVLLLQGREDSGQHELETLAADARKTEDYEILGWALGSLARAAALAGDTPEAMARMSECLEIAEQAGALSSRVRAAVNMSLVHIIRGAYKDAVRVVTEILPLARERRIGLDHEPFLLACQAEALARDGRPSESLPLAEEAVALAIDYGTRAWEIPARLSLARSLLMTRSARDPAFERELEHARELIGQTGARAFRGWWEHLAAESPAPGIKSAS